MIDGDSHSWGRWQVLFTSYCLEYCLRPKERGTQYCRIQYSRQKTSRAPQERVSTSLDTDAVRGLMGVWPQIGVKHFQDNENHSKRLTFILVHIISFFSLLFYFSEDALYSYLRNSSTLLLMVWTDPDKPIHLSLEAPKVISTEKTQRSEDPAVTDTFSLDQAVLTRNCSRVIRLKGLGAGCFRQHFFWHFLFFGGFLRDRFLVLWLPIVNCECVLISCHGKMDR